MQCLLGVRFSGDRTPCAGGGGARPAERRHEGNEGVADREAAGFRRKGESARRLAGSGAPADATGELPAMLGEVDAGTAGRGGDGEAERPALVVVRGAVAGMNGDVQG